MKLLFLCTGNACRSQMAEGWARTLHGDRFEVHSAGTDPHGLDPRAVLVMAEVGVDISGHRSKRLDEVPVPRFDGVVTVCDRAREVCPIPPGAALVLHQNFDDPPFLARTAETAEEALGHYRRVRDEIRAFVFGLPELLRRSRNA